MLSYFLTPLPAFGETAESFRPLARYSLRYDDNVFGARSNMPDSITGEQDAKADFSQTVSAGFMMDGKVERQILTGKVIFNRTRYDTYNRFDIDGRDLTANWKWVVGNHLEGSIGINYSKGLTPFSEAEQVTSNVRTQQRTHLDAAWRLHPDWRVRSAFTGYQIKYATVSQQNSSREEDQVSLGIDRLTRSGSIASLLLVHVDGNQFRLVNPNGASLTGSYVQDEIRASLDWPVSAKTRMQFSVGQVSRRPGNMGMQDFNGTSARITAIWQGTGKLSMTGSAWREVAVIDDLRTNVPSFNTGTSLVTRWQMSEKNSLDLTARYEQLDLKRSLSPLAESTQERTDSVTTLLLGLTYRPLRNLTVQGLLFHRRREYGLQGGSVIKNGMSITVQQLF